MKAQDWSMININNDIDEMTESFISTLNTCIEKNTIVVKMATSKKIKKPWITKHLLNEITQKNQLQKV